MFLLFFKCDITKQDSTNIHLHAKHYESHLQCRICLLTLTSWDKVSVLSKMCCSFKVFYVLCLPVYLFVVFIVGHGVFSLHGLSSTYKLEYYEDFKLFSLYLNVANFFVLHTKKLESLTEIYYLINFYIDAIFVFYL